MRENEINDFKFDMNGENMKFFNVYKELFKEIKRLEWKNKCFDEKIDSIIEENKQLQRIVENYIPEKITFLSRYYDVDSFKGLTYLYKDGHEYKIDNLILKKPEFEVSENGYILTIKDWKNKGKEDEKYSEYVVDLPRRSYIQTV